MQVRAGQLDRLITIETPTLVSGEYGNQPGPWAPLIPLPGSPTVGGKLPANRRDVLPSRSEAVRLGLEMGRIQTIFTIRYRSDVTLAMRVTEHGETDTVYTISAAPAEIGRREWLEFGAERFTS